MADEAWMRNQQSVHMARMWWCRARDSADAKPAERSLKGKGDSARQRDYCPFTMVVRMEGFDATGGASKARMP